MTEKNESVLKRRQRRIRHRIKTQSSGRLRLSVIRSNKQIYAQIIDDLKGVTLASASTIDKEVKGKLKVGSNIAAAKAVGELIAKRAKAAKVEKVVFDRGGYLYHGRVKALADAAREAGLSF